MRNYQAIVMGSSTGGLKVLEIILTSLREGFSLPIVIVQHIGVSSSLASILCQKTGLALKEAEDKEVIRGGWIYVAPPAYHLLIESDGTFSLSVEEKVNNARPAIDILFESAVDAYGGDLVGVILTGSNSDGALGLKKIHQKGGLTIVQDPKEAEAGEMSASAIREVKPDFVLPAKEIGPLLNSISLGSVSLGSLPPGKG